MNYRLFVMLMVVILLCGGIHNERKNTNTNQPYQRLSRQQRIAERFKQEAAFTQDPKTRQVPSERLIEAKSYTQKKLKEKGAVPGINWTERGPNNVSGRTRSILIDAGDPTRRTLFTGGIGGGIWKSTNDGASWTSVNEFFNNMAVTSIAQDPLNSNIIYFGTGESVGSYGRGMGIWKSIDGGQTFSVLPVTSNNRSFDFVNKLVVQNYQGSSVLYAATSSTDSSRGGLLYSYDGGNTFNLFQGNGTGANNFCSDVEITANGTVFAGFGGSGGEFRNIGNPIPHESDGVYFSSNAGGNWALSRASEFYEARIEIATSPDNPDQIYLLCENTIKDGAPTLYRSARFSGIFAWVPIIAPAWFDQNCFVPETDFTRNQDNYDLALAVYPGFPNSVLVGGIDLFLYQTIFDPFTGLAISDRWIQLTHWLGNCNRPKVHADQHTIVFKNSNEVYFGNDGGVYKSSNALSVQPYPANPLTASSVSFSFLGNGLNITQFYAADLDPRSGMDYYIAGAQDNGTVSLSQAALGNGTEVKGGDGMFCHIDQQNHNIQVVSNFNQFMHATTNAWQTSVQVGTPDKGRFVNPMDYDDVNKKIYAADLTGTFLRWEDLSTGGSTLTTVNVNGFPTNLQDNLPWAVRCSPNVPGRVYFGFDNGSVVRVDNAQTGTTKNSFEVMNLGLGERHAVSSIEIANGDENHILVTLSNYGITSVYESTNATSANPTWTAVEGNLPDMPIRWAMFNPSNTDQAFLATQLGVWSTDNLNGGATDWAPTNAGLANTRIDMIKYRTSDLQMVVASHGRGLFTSDDLNASCNGTLSLNNQVIAGSYSASNSITVNNSSVANNAMLSSPNLSFTGFTVNDNAQLTVNNNGCQ